MSTQTKWRIWWVPQVPMKAFEREVPDLATAEVLISTLANYDTFQFENNIKPDYCNAGGIQYSHPLIDEGDWIELEDDEHDRAAQIEEIRLAEEGAPA